MRINREILTVAALVLLAACKSGAPSVAAAPAPASIEPNAAELRADLFAFAADSFRGRETGTPDADRAAAWIARRLASLGLEPAGDSGFFQRVPMRRAQLTADSIVVTSPKGRTPWRLGQDLLVLTALGPGAPLPKLATDADVVFASQDDHIENFTGRHAAMGAKLFGRETLEWWGKPG